LAVTRLVKAGHIDYLTLFEKMCLNPAKLYRMKEAGRIREGGAADLVLFDDQTPYTVEKFHSKASNSPFVGAKLYGKVHYTICSGETVYRAE
jgi:dihydroorotase